MPQYFLKTIFIPIIFLYSLNAKAQEVIHDHAEQQEAVGHMHHELEDAQKPYKDAEAMALKELNEMTIRENVSLEDIYAKIDELMTAKNLIMRLRYEHLIEMRKVLSEEQRVKYDQNVLNRSEVR